MSDHHHLHLHQDKHLIEFQHAVKDLFLIQPITIENVLILLDNALKLKIHELEHKCMEFIEPQASKIIFDDGSGYKNGSLSHLSYHTVLHLVENGKLKIDEGELALQLDEWAVAECERHDIHPDGTNRRKILKNIFDHIRFPLFMKDWLDNKRFCNYFTEHELEDLHKFYQHDENPEYRPHFFHATHFHARG